LADVNNNNKLYPLIFSGPIAKLFWIDTELGSDVHLDGW